VAATGRAYNPRLMKIEANGLSTEYLLEGPAGAPVVTMSHSLAANLHLWDAQAAALRDRYRVLRYDIRGHGGTDVPPAPYTLEQMADDLHGLLQALGVGGTHFVGLSMGGLIGMTTALRHPGDIRSLVLADTTASYGPERAAMWDDRIRVAEAQGIEPLLDRTMEAWFTAPFRARRKDVVDGVRAMLRPTSVTGYVGAIRAIGYGDMREEIRAIRVPALILVGDEDRGTDITMARTMHERIAGSTLTVIPKAAHCSCVEAPEEFNRALRAFLDRIA
jgi:3-oxoadipate enol-lactonase